MEERLKEIARQTAAEFQATVAELEANPDHTCTGSPCRWMYLWFEADPQFGVHRLVKPPKGRAWRFLWAHASFLATAGGAAWAVIQPTLEQPKDG